MSHPVLLIGLDGATFTILDPLMEEGVMPFLKQFLGSGVRADLLSVIPPLTPPGWTSLTTGRSPGNHGVVDFVVPEAPDSRFLTLARSYHVGCETIWSILRRHGLRATAINFPLMAPPRDVAGYVVPGWVPWRHMRRSCYPQDLYDRLKEVPGFNVRDMVLDLKMDAPAIDGLPEAELSDWIKFHIAREQKWFDVLKYLMRQDPCELTAVVFDGVDKLQHLCWRFLDPSCLPQPVSAQRKAIRQLCLDYFRQLDELIAETVSLAGPEASVFLASDHGFGPSVEIFCLNAWLERNGYLYWLEGGWLDENEADWQGRTWIWQQLTAIDWSRTTAYALTPSGNGIRICVAGQSGSEGIPAAQYERVRQELAEALLHFVDPVTGKPVVTQVWTRDEAFAGSRMDLAPDLTVALRDGGFVSMRKSDALVKPRTEPWGAHRPEGIFIAGGAGIRKGVSLPQLSILDVTPMLLYALGLPVPEDLEGHVPSEVFEPSQLEKQPVRVGEPTHAPSPFFGTEAAAVEEGTQEGEAEVLARLKALGYLE